MNICIRLTAFKESLMDQDQFFFFHLKVLIDIEVFLLVQSVCYTCNILLARITPKIMNKIYQITK